MASWAHPSSCADIAVDTDDESVEPCEPHAALDLGDDASPRMYESADFGDLEQVGGRDPVPIFNASSQWRRQSTEAMMRLMMCVGGEEGKTYDEVVSHHYRPCELTPADALYDEIEELKKQVAALDEPRRRGDALPWQQGDDHCAVPGCTGASPDEGRRKRAPPHVCEDFEEGDFPEPPARRARGEPRRRPALRPERAYGAGCRDLGNALAWAPLDVDCDGVSLGRGSAAVAFRWSDGQPFGCAIHGGGDGILVLEDCFRAGAETLRGGKLARGSMGPRSHVDLRSLRRGGSSTHALLVHGGLVDLARTALAYVVCRDELEGEVYVTAREVRPHADMWPTVHHSLDVLGGPRGEVAVKLGGQRFDGEPVPDCFALALDGEPAAWAWSRCAVDPAAVRRPPAWRDDDGSSNGPWVFGVGYGAALAGPPVAVSQRVPTRGTAFALWRCSLLEAARRDNGLDLYLAGDGGVAAVSLDLSDGGGRPAPAIARAVLVDAPPAPEAGDERHAKRRFGAFFPGKVLLCFGGNDGERDRAWYDLAGHCWLDCHALDAAAGQWRRVDAEAARRRRAAPRVASGLAVPLFSNGDGAQGRARPGASPGRRRRRAQDAAAAIAGASR
ncbi:FAD dependent oxidoreductase [Aureococcus anophagefferens]|nr:FAD dependent oxidoreductase [Aureococcus anophagefferens]